MAEARPLAPGHMESCAAPRIVVLMTAIAFAVALCAAQPSAGEYQVKAAFLFNFAKFVEWPAGVIDKGKNPIVVGVLGNDPFGPALERTFEGKSVADRRFEIQRFRGIEQLRSCHILFISASERGDLRRILDVIRGTPVLTVSDAEVFVEAGGMIELLVEDKKIRFNINLQETKRSGLKVSAPLLQLARRVEGK